MVLHIFIFFPLYKFLYGSFISYYIVLFPATGKQHIAQFKIQSGEFSVWSYISDIKARSEGVGGLYSNTKLKNIVLETFYNIFT